LDLQEWALFFQLGTLDSIATAIVWIEPHPSKNIEARKGKLQLKTSFILLQTIPTEGIVSKLDLRGFYCSLHAFDT